MLDRMTLKTLLLASVLAFAGCASPAAEFTIDDAELARVMHEISAHIGPTIGIEDATAPQVQSFRLECFVPEEVSLRDVCEQLSQYYGVNILVDPDVPEQMISLQALNKQLRIRER
jgi:hypothetical protein